MRRLTLEDVPESERHRFNFDEQGYVPKTPTERTLVIEAKCDLCDNTLKQRVTDVRAKFKVHNAGITLLCSACRMGRTFQTKEGYVVAYRPDHPNAHKSGSIYEHVLVMAESLGRPLASGENVHHKNGVRNDNRLENLELWSVSQPAGQRLEDKVRWAVELKARYPTLWDAVEDRMRIEADGEQPVSPRPSGRIRRAWLYVANRRDT